MEELKTSEDIGPLDDLVEAHAQKLLNILSRPHTVKELETEAAALSELLYTFARRNDLIEKLLDTATPEEKRSQITAALKALCVDVGRNREKLVQLREHSDRVIEQSRSLIAKAKQEIVAGAQLREEILALEAWIEDRSEFLGKELAERSERTRHLMRINRSDEDLRLEHRKMEALKKEIDSLNELRQVLIFKRALLRKIEDGGASHTP
jgi:hypothetical protein